MGLDRALLRAEVLETNVTERMFPEVAEGTNEGLIQGSPDFLHRFAMISEMQRTQKSRMNQALQASFEFRARKK
eukprot:1084171-Pyramimonas_sp.AAC.1